MSDDYDPSIEQLRALEQSLIQLEARLQFNLFEAIGVTTQELRHSDFLRFLLDPNEKHGLQDLFLRKLLSATGLPVTGTLTDAEVKREEATNHENQQGRIDLLITSTSQKLAIVIENKVGSQEHSDQTSRYEHHVLQAYPDYHHGFIYLTPRESEAKTTSYRLLKYKQVAEILKDILDDSKVARQLKTDVKVTIEHYIELLWRFVVPESEIAKLSRQIYDQHRHAIEIVFQHRSSLQKRLAEYFKNKLNNQRSPLNLVKHPDSDERRIDFWLKDWERFIDTLSGGGDNCILSYRYWSGDKFPEEEGVKLHLAIKPAPALESLRMEILRIARANPDIFNVTRGGKDTDWKSIYQCQILTKQQLREYSFTELTREIDRFWDNFFQGDFERIKQIISQVNYPSA